MSDRVCAEHEKLTKQAHDHLKKLHELVEQQLGAFDSGENERFLKIDKEVELALGEKERRIGALRQHDEEHGCQGNTLPDA